MRLFATELGDKNKPGENNHRLLLGNLALMQTRKNVPRPSKNRRTGGSI